MEAQRNISREEQVLELVLAAWRYKKSLRRFFVEMPHDEYMCILAEVKAIWENKFLTRREKTMLRHFLNSAQRLRLLGVAKSEQRYIAPLDRDDRLAILAAHRKKIARIAKYHPLGQVIGGTQVNEYKSARSNISWASKRRRKP